MIPRSLVIPLCYDPMGDPLYHGEFCDVWKGNHRGRGVAAKVLRVYPASDFRRIANVRSRLVMCINN